MRKFITKSADERLDYNVDMSVWLEGDTITSVTTSAPVGTLLIDALAINAGANAFSFWVDNGLAGDEERISCLINTAAGRVKELKLVVLIG